VHDGASARVAAVLLPQTSAAVRVVNVDADLDGGPIGSVSTKCGVGVPEPIDAEIRDAEATARCLRRIRWPLPLWRVAQLEAELGGQLTPGPSQPLPDESGGTRLPRVEKGAGFIREN